MMRRIGIVMLVLGVVACSGATVVTEADDGGTIELEVGDEFELALPANPSTGFTWVFGPFDANVIEQIDGETYEAESDALGAPGTLTYRFAARAEGTVVLTLTYEREFEDVEPEDTFTLTVNVG